MKNILFITWDGSQTSYMEGLFIPVLSQVQEESEYVFHIIQFTWGTSKKIKIIQNTAKKYNLIYTARKIVRKPTVILGNLLTLYNGIQFLKKYIIQNNISILMPRSTMPAIMVNRILKRNSSLKIVFDADGLPIDERVDFSGLLRNTVQYRFFKHEEFKILSHADLVLTRSFESIKIHLKVLKNKHSEKFSVVFNGRDTNFFKPNDSQRNQMRKKLSFSTDAKGFVYCGSLGPQYGWDEMIVIFNSYHKNNSNSFFLILTGDVQFAQERIPNGLKHVVQIRTVPFSKVPHYLSVADVAFAIREPKFSMKGVAPIKLGEYLLMGIPTIASIGIGDTEKFLNSVPNCHLYNHHSSSRVEEAVNFVSNLKEPYFEEIRKCGLTYFSVENSVISYCNALNKL